MICFAITAARLDNPALWIMGTIFFGLRIIIDLCMPQNTFLRDFSQGFREGLSGKRR